MVRGEKLMVSFSVAHDYVPDGLVVDNPDYIVPFPPDHPESTPHGVERAWASASNSSSFLCVPFGIFSTPLADVELI